MKRILIVFIMPLLACPGDPSEPELLPLITRDNTVVYAPHLLRNGPSNNSSGIDSGYRFPEVPTELFRTFADQSYSEISFGARFQESPFYHPIHNDRTDAELSGSKLGRKLAFPGKELARDFDKTSVSYAHKNLLYVFNPVSPSLAIAIQDKISEPELRLSKFTDLVFLGGSAVESVGTQSHSSLLAELAKEANCASASAVLFTPRGIDKIRHLLSTVHEEPAKQLGRYFGLNLRTFCLRDLSDKALIPVIAAAKDFTLTDKVEFESDVKTYVLNLDRSAERLKGMTNSLNAAGVRFTRFSAIDGKGDDFSIDEQVRLGNLDGIFHPDLPYHPIHLMGPEYDLRRDEYFGDNPYEDDIRYRCIESGWTKECLRKYSGLGTAACGLSHVSMISKHFDAFPSYHGLFFEDDVKISEDFKERFDRAMKNIPSNWDIIYLDYHDTDCVKKTVSPYLSRHLDGRTCVPGDFALLINKNSAKKIRALMKPLYEDSDRHIMKYFGWALNAYWVKNSLVSVELGSPSERKAAD